MKLSGLIAEGVEVMGDVVPKMAKKRNEATGNWDETGSQTERDGLRAWDVTVLVQDGEDARVREPVKVTVFGQLAPKVVDTEKIRFGELDVRGYDKGKLGLTARNAQVVRDGKWFFSDETK